MALTLAVVVLVARVVVALGEMEVRAVELLVLLIQVAVVAVQVVQHLADTVLEMVVLGLLLFLTLALNEALAELLHLQVATQFTHSHQVAHSQDKNKWKNYKSPHNCSIHSLAI